MKSLLAPVPAHPRLLKKHTPEYSPATTKTRKKPTVQDANPPSEERVQLLNGIAREYPFCVYYKVKRNDPL